MRKRARTGRLQRHRALAELELMPMLNVFIAIIPLLLLSAAFVPVTVIQATLPAGSAAAAPAAAETPLDLAITLRRSAYLVEANGAVVARIARPEAAARDSAGVATALGQLGAVLTGIATAHPQNREVRIVSEPTTRYEDIVEVMDVARTAGLPEAALAETLPEAS